MGLVSGRYQFVRELGAGESGRVWLVLDRAAAEAPRALKWVRADAEERVRCEFALASRIAHPNLARVFELVRGSVNELGARAPRAALGVVSEYVAGEPVSRAARPLAARRPELLRFALRVLDRTARALAALHAQGLVHGDVKPEHLLIWQDGEELRLIDLGFARAPGFDAQPSGTPHYMAPELWRGEVSPAADVYALGLVLRELFVPGEAPAERASAAEHFARSLQPRAAGPSWVPEPLRALLDRMSAPDRGVRIGSALELLDALAGLAPALGPLLANELAGEAAAERGAQVRASAIAALPLIGQGPALQALTAALASSRVIEVFGPLGAGRSRVVREAVFALQMERAAGGKSVPTYRVVTRLPAVADESCCVLHVSDADDIAAAEVEALQRAAQLLGHEYWVVLECTRAQPDRSHASVSVAPLEAAALQSLLRAALPEQSVREPLLREAAAVSGGLAGRLCRVLAAARLSAAELGQAGALRALAASADVAVARVPEPALPLARLLAVAGGGASYAVLSHALPELELASAAHALCTLGLCTRSEHGRLWLRPDVQRELWLQLTASERVRLAGRFGEGEGDARARGFLACARGDLARAQAEFALAAEQALANGDPAAAEAGVREAAGVLGEMPEALAWLRAEALRAAGRYPEALAQLDDVSGEAAAVLRAELLRLRGDAAGAQAIASGLLEGPPEPASPAARAACRALLGRLALDAGDREACRAHARAAASGDDERAALRASELLALADLAAGRLDAAREHVEAGLSAARRRGERVAEARLLAVAGAIERAAGTLAAAARSFGRAYELALLQGEYHAAASFMVNLGTAQLDAGELGLALRSLRTGASHLARLGRDRDGARALANLVLAAQLIGDFSGALAAGARAVETARRADDALALSFALLSCAEVCIERGELDAARAQLAQLPDSSGLAPSDRAVALARSAGVWSALGEQARALLQLSAAEAMLPEAAAAGAECALARAQLARHGGDAAGALEHAERALGEAKARAEFPLIVLSLTAAGHAAEAAGQAALARSRFSELRVLLDGAALTLTAAERAGLRSVRAYRAALAALPSSSEAAGQVDQRFRQLTWHVKRLTSETRLSRLYELILETAVALSGAESGVLLRRDGDRIRVRALFGVAGALVASAAQWSQSIVARVFATGQALSTVDAAQDQRLSAASSVHALSLRSVLALPLRSQDSVPSVIYLEDRLRPFAFGEAEVALLSDFSDLASLAITGVERLRRERRAVRKLSLAQARLAKQVEQQALELAAYQRTHAAEAEAHTGIVAQSALMRDVLSLALRVANSDVPVLIRGESGTGKELVARAIHGHGTRKHRPFVSESCAAIPEPLLESALFGHVKGAFTGADRRRVGLFEAADGGTLFLDEIGEMSPAMQMRLLRVLQEGEVRPLGGERTVKVDVRVLAATHRDLESMVAAGTFREDLFYRLAVVNIALPPLRERHEDVIPLVQHFISKHAPERSPRLERRALERLLAHPWPGNVRQLENEVRRALVLGGDVLREEHFGFAQPKEAAGKANDLNLRAQIDELERKLIRRALELAKGNQTRAAELLGVSRFGLQKMVKRLDLSFARRIA